MTVQTMTTKKAIQIARSPHCYDEDDRGQAWAELRRVAGRSPQWREKDLKDLANTIIDYEESLESK